MIATALIVSSATLVIVSGLLLLTQRDLRRLESTMSDIEKKHTESYGKLLHENAELSRKYHLTIASVRGLHAETDKILEGR